MANTPGSKDKALEALDFIINVLKEHEQTLDKSIQELATVTEQSGDTESLNSKIEKFDEKINLLQKDVTDLTAYLTNAPKEALPAAIKKVEPQVQATPAISSMAVQSGASVILHCAQWVDFQVLAMHAQTLTFSLKDQEKVFQASALKGNQIITYTGAPPNIAAILKTWLSKQLDTPERNVLEGYFGNPK
jgi:hypothetical protein